MRSMEVVGVGPGEGAGGGAEGSAGAHFCIHGAPRLGAGGARFPPDEDEAAAAAVEEEEAGRDEERRRSGRRWRWGREERRKEWWMGSSDSAMEMVAGWLNRVGGLARWRHGLGSELVGAFGLSLEIGRAHV